MNWFFKINKALPYSVVEILFQPENELISIFFNSIKLQNFPILLRNSSRLTGFSEERSGILFYGDIDEYDISVGEGFNSHEVKIYHLDFGVQILEKKFFFEILYSYSSELLNVYKDANGMPDEWIAELANDLLHLKAKM